MLINHLSVHRRTIVQILLIVGLTSCVKGTLTTATTENSSDQTQAQVSSPYLLEFERSQKDEFGLAESLSFVTLHTSLEEDKILSGEEYKNYSNSNVFNPKLGDNEQMLYSQPRFLKSLYGEQFNLVQAQTDCENAQFQETLTVADLDLDDGYYLSCFQILYKDTGIKESFPSPDFVIDRNAPDPNIIFSEFEIFDTDPSVAVLRLYEYPDIYKFDFKLCGQDCTTSCTFEQFNLDFEAENYFTITDTTPTVLCLRDWDRVGNKSYWMAHKTTVFSQSNEPQIAIEVQIIQPEPVVETPPYPTVVSIKRVSDEQATAGTVDFEVIFSADVGGVDADDFAIDEIGTTGAFISSVEGRGAIYTVTVNTGLGAGTLSIDLIDDNSINDTSNNVLGGPDASDGNFTQGETYTLDGAVEPSIVVSAMSAPDGATYHLGEDLSFTITFSGAVVVTGIPRLVLTVGAQTRYANYVSVSGGVVLTFTYVTQASDLDLDGIEFSSTNIDLSSGTIVSGADNNVDQSFSSRAPALTSVHVDTSAPTTPTGLTLLNPATSLGVDSTPEIRISGVNDGYEVRLYSNNTCSTQIGSAFATGSTINITTNSLTAGSYEIFANSIFNGQTSGCSSNKTDYIYSLITVVQKLEPAGLDVENNIWRDSSGNDLDANLVESHSGTFTGSNNYIDFGDNDIFQVATGTLATFYIPVVNGATRFITGIPYRGTPGWTHPFTGFQLGHRTDALVFFFNINGSHKDFPTNGVFTPGQVYHLAASWDGTTARVYVNGAEVNNSSALGSGNISYSGSPHFVIGTRSIDALGESAFGQVWGTKFYDTVLTLTEIATLANGGDVISGKVLDTPLAEGAGSTIYDVSGNDNHGTMHGTTEAAFWANTQSVFHWNLSEGFSTSEQVKIPALADGTRDAAGNSITNPAGDFHNGAETGIQRNPTNDALLLDATPSVPSSDIFYYGDPAIENLKIISGNNQNRTNFVTFEESPY